MHIMFSEIRESAKRPAVLLYQKEAKTALELVHLANGAIPDLSLDIQLSV